MHMARNETTRQVRSGDQGSPTRVSRKAMSVPLALGVGFVMAVGAACVPPTAAPIDDVPLDMSVYVVDGDIDGVSFAKSADVIGDSAEELVISKFGSPTSDPGTVTIYSIDGDLGSWIKTPVVTAADDIKFPNDTEIADLNDDGRQDLIVPGGFFSCSFSGTGCGSLQWFEQLADGSFDRHNIVSPDQQPTR